MIHPCPNCGEKGQPKNRYAIRCTTLDSECPVREYSAKDRHYAKA